MMPRTRTVSCAAAADANALTPNAAKQNPSAAALALCILFLPIFSSFCSAPLRIEDICNVRRERYRRIDR
jgi:hypothetical protein